MYCSLEEIEEIEKNSNIYESIIGNTIEMDFQNIIEKKKDIKLFMNSIQNKMAKMESVIIIDLVQLKSLINNVKISISDIKTQKENKTEDYRNKQNNLEILVKGAIGLEIKQSQSIKDRVKEIKTKEDELDSKLNANKEKQLEIQKLKQQKSPTKDFAIFVSQILNDINISLNIQIDLDSHNYLIKSPHDDVVLTINEISEGEKNLLALLFFYYELFNDNKQQQVKADIELVIVDDPISSMDDSNKFYILELIKNILNLANQQVFILSHSWEDFCNLSWGKKAWDVNSKYALYELKKANGKSDLLKLLNLEKPYKYLFKEVYTFSQKNENQIESSCEIYHYPNVMRRVFEEWYNFKIGKNLNLTSTQQDRLANDLNLSNNTQKAKLGTLLSVCNILSHSIMNSKNVQEIHSSAKFLMELVEKNDKLHFHYMKE